MNTIQEIKEPKCPHCNKQLTYEWTDPNILGLSNKEAQHWFCNVCTKFYIIIKKCLKSNT